MNRKEFAEGSPRTLQAFGQVKGLKVVFVGWTYGSIHVESLKKNEGIGGP